MKDNSITFEVNISKANRSVENKFSTKGINPYKTKSIATKVITRPYAKFQGYISKEDQHTSTDDQTDSLAVGL